MSGGVIRLLFSVIALVFIGGLAFGEETVKIVKQKVTVQTPWPGVVKILASGFLRNEGEEPARCILVDGLCSNFVNADRWRNLAGDAKGCPPPISAAQASEETCRLGRIDPGCDRPFVVSCQMSLPPGVLIKNPDVKLKVRTVRDDCPWLEDSAGKSSQ